MDTNLFIKSYKTEGNKITDIEFYGDKTLDMGAGAEGTVVKKAVKGLPDGVVAELLENEYIRFINNTNSTYSIKIVNRSDALTIGFCGASNLWSILQLRAGNKTTVSIPRDTKGYGERFVYCVLTQAGKAIGYVKAGIKNGQAYIEGV